MWFVELFRSVGRLCGKALGCLGSILVAGIVLGLIVGILCS